MMNYTRRAIIGIAWIFVLGMITNLFAYLLRILLARELSPQDFGLVYSIIAFFGLIYILQHMGLNEALTRVFAQSNSRNEWKKAKSATIFVIGFQMITAIILYIVLFNLRDFLAGSYFQEPYAANAIVLHGILLVLLPLQTFFESFFQGFQNMKLFGSLLCMRACIVLLCTGIGLQIGFGILAPFLAYIIATVVPLPLWFFYAKKVKPQFFSAKSLINPHLIKSLFSFGIPLIVTSVASFVISYTDTLVLTFFRPLTEVGIYNAAMPTASLLWFFGNSLYVVVFPLSAELTHRRLHQHVQEGLQRLYQYALVFVIPIMLSMIVFAEGILSIFFGEVYITGATVFRILTFGAVFFTLARINDAVLAGVGKTYLVSRAAGSAAIVNLILAIILVPLFGINGAAIATFTSFIVMFVIGFKNVRKIFTIKCIGSYKIILISIGYILVQWGLFVNLPGELLFRMIGSGSISLGMYCVAVMVTRLISLKDLNLILKK